MRMSAKGKIMCKCVIEKGRGYIGCEKMIDEGKETNQQSRKIIESDCQNCHLCLCEMDRNDRLRSVEFTPNAWVDPAGVR